MNIQSLECHGDEKQGNYENKRAIMALKKTRLTENDVLQDNFNLKNINHHLNETKNNCE